METIPREQCRKIGLIRKSHGVKGEVILEFEPEINFAVTETSRFFIDLDGLLVPFFISGNGLRLKSSNSAILKFEWVESEKYATRLIGKEVYLFLSEIDMDMEGDYFSGLVDYQVYNEDNEFTGVVSEAENFSGNVVLKVVSAGKEFLIPFNEDLLISIDEQMKIIHLQIPEGLIS
jgi:16S rRNA processing protein RimM